MASERTFWKVDNKVQKPATYIRGFYSIGWEKYQGDPRTGVYKAGRRMRTWGKHQTNELGEVFPHVQLWSLIPMKSSSLSHNLCIFFRIVIDRSSCGPVRYKHALVSRKSRDHWKPVWWWCCCFSFSLVLCVFCWIYLPVAHLITAHSSWNGEQTTASFSISPKWPAQIEARDSSNIRQDKDRTYLNQSSILFNRRVIRFTRTDTS